MQKEQLGVLGVGLLMTAGVLLLPKGVIHNENKNLQEQTSQQDAAGNEKHRTVSKEQLEQLSPYRKQLQSATTEEETVVALDSLSFAYRKANLFDSVAVYSERVADKYESVESISRAAEAWMDAYMFETNKESASAYAQTAVDLYRKALEMDTENYEVRTKLGAALVQGVSPMEGITLLKEVERTQPKYVPAIYELGVNSIRVEKFSKAINRLRKVVLLDPMHVEAHFYLGVALTRIGKNEEAGKAFAKAKSISDDPGLKESIDSFMSQQ